MRIIVTGGNSGVGKATASALAADGHSVLIACRTLPKAEQAAAEMTGDVEVAHLDLADLTSVRKFADSVQTVDVLVNNAGVFGLPLTHTVDGFETTMGTNHLGHFALTCLLGDKIKDRVVSVASRAYALSRIDLDDLEFRKRKYTKWSAYGESKLAVMLFVQELARRGVRAYATDPGSTNTEIARESTGIPGLGPASQGDRSDVLLAHARAGSTGQHPGGDDRPAQWHLPGPSFQPVGQTEGHQDP